MGTLYVLVCVFVLIYLPFLCCISNSFVQTAFSVSFMVKQIMKDVTARYGTHVLHVSRSRTVSVSWE